MKTPISRTIMTIPPITPPIIGPACDGERVFERNGFGGLGGPDVVGDPAVIIPPRSR